MKFLFVRPDVCRRLPSDSTSQWTPLPLAIAFPLLGQLRDLHPLDNTHAERTKSAVLTIIERSKLFFLQKKLPSKRPEDVQKAIVQLLIPYKKYVLTITTDNGMEFRNHKAVCKALDCTVYFADPYCSGQKGAIENTNKLLREFFPKGTDFRMVTQQQLNQAQYAINERPRKKLDFSTLKVEFFKNIL